MNIDSDFNSDPTSADNRIHPMDKTELLYMLLQKELGYYRAILELIHKEQELLAEKNQEALRPLLKKKQTLLLYINQLDAAIIPLKKNWMAHVEKNSIISQQISSAWTDLDKILQKILATEKT